MRYPGDRSIIHREGLQRVLHAIVRGGLPDELRHVALCDVQWYVTVPHLQCYLA